MENKGLINPQDLQIQGVIDRYLRSKVSGDNSSIAASDRHLDEDSLAAFTEGNLSQREAQPIVSHLVDCSFCRHVTAELIRLDLAFAGEEIQPAAAIESQPSKISEVLSNLLSRIFGTNDGADFAHQEEQQEEQESENTEESEDIKK
jgi:hypothetical protein